MMAVKQPGSNSPLTERRISLLPGPNENHNLRTVFSDLNNETNCTFIWQTFEISNRIDKAFKCNSYWLPFSEAITEGNRKLSFL